MKFTFEGITLKNNRPFEKPNEDLYFFDESIGFAIVLDGVSRDKENGMYPVPSPSLEVTVLFSQLCRERLKNGIFDEANEERKLSFQGDLYNLMELGNEKIYEYNQHNPHEFPAGTVGILLYVAKEKMYYAYIGDCNGVLIRNGNKKWVTKKQTEQVMLHKKELTTKQIRYEICNHIEHPYGYGVLDGNYRAMDFVKTGEETLKKGDIILLYSDGAEHVIDAMPGMECGNAHIRDMVSIVDSVTGETMNCDDQTIIRVTVL